MFFRDFLQNMYITNTHNFHTYHTHTPNLTYQYVNIISAETRELEICTSTIDGKNSFTHLERRRVRKITFIHYIVSKWKPETERASIAAAKSTRSYIRSLQSVYHCTSAKLYRPHFVWFLALYHECKTRPGQVLREEAACMHICACMLAAGQTHSFAMHELKINTTSTCTDAPFHPSVSIHLLSVACLPPCMITRAVVKVSSTGQ